MGSMLDQTTPVRSTNCLVLTFMTGLLVWLKALHSLDFRHPGSIYVFSEHTRASVSPWESAGLKGIKASRVWADPKFVQAVHPTPQDEVEFSKQSSIVNCLGTESSPASSVPLLARLGTRHEVSIDGRLHGSDMLHDRRSLGCRFFCHDADTTARYNDIGRHKLKFVPALKWNMPPPIASPLPSPRHARLKKNKKGQKSTPRVT